MSEGTEKKKPKSRRIGQVIEPGATNGSSLCNREPRRGHLERLKNPQQRVIFRRSPAIH
jgi:hypothetical protein